MKNLIVPFVLVALVAWSCSENQNDNGQPLPEACFSIDTFAEYWAGDTLQFTNCSTNASYYLWDFGDKTYSLEKKPLHVFGYADTFSVTLWVSDKTFDDKSDDGIIDANDVGSETSKFSQSMQIKLKSLSEIDGTYNCVVNYGGDGMGDIEGTKVTTEAKITVKLMYDAEKRISYINWTGFSLNISKVPNSLCSDCIDSMYHNIRIDNTYNLVNNGQYYNCGDIRGFVRNNELSIITNCNTNWGSSHIDISGVKEQ